MSRSCFEQAEQKRLLPSLNKRSLDTSPLELRQRLAYVYHLRSLWKPEGRTKLIVPASWMKFLVLDADDGKCTTRASGATDRPCPFRDVRFESSDAGIRHEEILPRDVVSQVLTSSSTAGDRLATFVSRAFEGIPRTRLSWSDVPGATPSPRHPTAPNAAHGHIVDFALVAGDGSNDAKNVFSGPESIAPPCLLLGTTGTLLHPHSAAISEGLYSYCQFHLARLVLQMKREAEPFPEWLVLFGLLYDTHHVLVVAYVPHRQGKSDVMDCAAYVVDQLSFPPLFTVDGTRACELAFARLRFLAALATLRRHAHELSRLLFATIRVVPPSDGVGGGTAQESDDSESLIRCTTSLGSSLHCSTEYSTCPSSVHSREVIDVPDHECKEELSSSYRSFASYCSTCSSLLESASTSESSRSGSSRYTDFCCMELSTTPPPQRDGERDRFSDRLVEAKRRDIIAWAQQVVATEHPVKDTYRMVIYHPHPGRQRVADSKSNTSK